MRFTVNCATYNQLPILKLILKSLEDQPFKDFEIIVCDDGSSDGTLEYFTEHPTRTYLTETERDGEVFIEIGWGNGYKYFWQEDKGFRLARSKNNGIKASSGDYFISLEADVIPNKNLLVEYNLWAKPNTVLFGVRHDIEGVPETHDSAVLDEKIVARDFRMEDLKLMFKEYITVHNPWRFCSGCNFLIPTDKIKEIAGWNENFKHYGIDDYEVCARLYKAGCKFLPVFGAYGYHIKHELRATSDENRKLLEEAERSLGL